MYQITDEDILLTLSKNRREKELEKRFHCRYATANTWKRLLHRDIEQGYLRFIIEHLEHLNFKQLELLHKKIESKREINYCTISTVASILKMPLSEIQKADNSLVVWKKNYVNFLLSMDEEVLRLQHKMLFLLLDARETSEEDERAEQELIAAFFKQEEAANVLSLNNEQKQDASVAPTKEQLAAVTQLAGLKGKVIPPKVRLYAVRLERWAKKISQAASV